MPVVIIIILVLAILLVIFTLQNSIEITINVFFWEITNAPLVLVLICCVVIGYLLGAIYLYPQVWKLRKENRRAKRLNRELEAKQGTFKPTPEEENPEGIELDDEDNENDQSFFKE